MYVAERYLQHQREIIDPKGAILKSNLSLQEKYKALVELDVPFSLAEILDSHPVDWSEEDRHIRKVWLRRMSKSRPRQEQTEVRGERQPFSRGLVEYR